MYNMESGLQKYKYFKVLNRITRYGEVHIVINNGVDSARVIDACTWKQLKREYLDFQELEILKIWRKSSKLAAESILRNQTEGEPIEIVIKDIIGIYAD